MINLIGIAVILFIIWWFWLAKAKPQAAGQNRLIEIIVDDGAYTPSTFKIEKAKPYTLRFIRKDPNPCAEKVIFSELNISEDLEINNPKELILIVNEPGKYDFTCQMGMYRGTVLVE